MIPSALVGLDACDVAIFTAIEQMAEKKKTLREKQKVWQSQLRIRAEGHGIPLCDLCKNARIWQSLRPIEGIHGISKN